MGESNNKEGEAAMQHQTGNILVDELPLARATDPETSHEAAQSFGDLELNLLRSLVLNVLKQHPDGLTDHELTRECVRLGSGDYQWDTYRKRRSDLTNLGLVVATTVRRERSTVWKAVEA